MERVAAATTNNMAVHTEDAEGVDAKAEDKDLLHKPHKTQTFLRSADNLHHFLVAEQECRHHQIL